MTHERFDLSKQTFSGAPLTPLENARTREMLEAFERSRWMKKQAWIWGAWAVGAPAIVLGMVTGIKGVVALFVAVFQGRG
jgi:hypothetical protein